jgi:hypothetical protein
MESQQMMEFLLAMREDMKVMQAKADVRHEEARSNQANTDAALQVMQEKAEIGRNKLLTKLEDDRQANMKAWREEMAAMTDKWTNDKHNETLACRETTEARPEKKEPTLVDMKPEAAEQ